MDNDNIRAILLTDDHDTDILLDAEVQRWHSITTDDGVPDMLACYYRQLDVGCGDINCLNSNCATGGRLNLTERQFTMRAVELFLQHAPLCRNLQNLLRTQMQVFKAQNVLPPAAAKVPAKKTRLRGLAWTTSESDINEVMSNCEKSKNFDELVSLVGIVFSTKKNLSRSFARKGEASTGSSAVRNADQVSLTAAANEAAEVDGNGLPRNLRIIEYQTEIIDESNIDYPAYRRTMLRLLQAPPPGVIEKLLISLKSLVKSCRSTGPPKENIYCLLLIFDIIAHVVHQIEYTPTRMELEYNIFPAACQAVRALSPQSEACIVRAWAREYNAEALLRIVKELQHIITMESLRLDMCPHRNSATMAAVRTLKLAYYANILDPIPEADVAEPKPVTVGTLPCEALEQALGITMLKRRSYKLPLEAFVNAKLSSSLDLVVEQRVYERVLESEQGFNNALDAHFSYMLHPFCLSLAARSSLLLINHRSRVRHSLRSGQEWTDLFFRLSVRRTDLLADAFAVLEDLYFQGSELLRCQHVVIKFLGEEGVDQGGLSREFFQLLFQQILSEDFGMFRCQEETGNYWFSCYRAESERYYEVVGLLVALALQNGINIPLRLPAVFFRKLLGCQGSYEDMRHFSPAIYSSMQQLLAYAEHDMGEVIMQTFSVFYQNSAGALIEHELQPSGRDVLVEQHNKHLFVELYTDFLLNKSIEQQFKLFKRGFDFIMKQTPLLLLLQPDELEFVICGTDDLDFVALQRKTIYKGFRENAPVLEYLWAVLHEFSEEMKRKFLVFTTGSDRAPVGGLAELKFIVYNNGTDTDKLPSAQTCFDTLMLPEYTSKEQLEERLLKAICYTSGFGLD